MKIHSVLLSSSQTKRRGWELCFITCSGYDLLYNCLPVYGLMPGMRLFGAGASRSIPQQSPRNPDILACAEETPALETPESPKNTSKQRRLIVSNYINMYNYHIIDISQTCVLSLLSTIQLHVQYKYIKKP